MKDHIPTIAMLAALAMILGTLIILALSGMKPDGPILLGLVSGASSMAGAIGGFSMNNSRTPAQVNNLPDAHINTTIEK